MSKPLPSDALLPERSFTGSGDSPESIALSLAQVAIWQLDADTWQVSINEPCRRLLSLPGVSFLSFDEFTEQLGAVAKGNLKGAIQDLLHDAQEQAEVETGRLVFKAKKSVRSGTKAPMVTGIVKAIPLVLPELSADYKSNATQVGLFQINLKAETIDYTPALALILTGVPATGLSRKDLIRHIHPEDAAGRQRAYEAAVETGDLYYEGRAIWQDGSIHWIRTTGTYFYNQSGEPVHFIGIIQDITQEKIRENGLRETESRFRNMIHQAPMAIALMMGRDLNVEVGNDKIFELWGKPATLLGRPLLEVIPEIQGQAFPKLLQSVYDTGQPFFGEGMRVDLVRNGRSEAAYFDFTYTPLRDPESAVNGIMVMANEVTAQVMARKKVEESEQRFITLIEEAPFATALYKGPTHVIELANDAMIRLWGKDSSVIGKRLSEALPELEGQPFLNLLHHVYVTGQSHHEKEAGAQLVVDGKLSTFYFNYTYKPIRDEHGQIYAILNMAVDVTNQVLAHRRLQESELLARSILYNSPVAKLVLTGAEQTITVANENLLQLFGKTDRVLHQPFREAFPDLWTAMHEQLDQVLNSGKTFTANEASYPITRAGHTETGYFNLNFKALPSALGGYHGVIVTLVDVTEQVRNRTRIAEAKEAFKGAIELAELGTWEMNVPQQTLIYSARLATWMGLESETPVSEEKALLSIHPDDRELVHQKLLQAQSAGTKEGFNAEYRIVHPLSDKERIVHAQGITYYDLKGKPLKMTGTVRDVTKERQTQAALELEVKKRTSELNLLNKQLTNAVSELAATNEQLKRSNEDLAQYAHVASHDLQEPLRKIRMFSGMLKDQPAPLPGNASLVHKINESAERMSLLIKDLLDYSRLLKTEDLKKMVDLNEVIGQIMVDFELRIQEKNAVVTLTPMPVIEAVPLQMSQLFFNLIGNALKFSVPDRRPEIHVTATIMEAGAISPYLPLLNSDESYYHITIRDNGIGFEEKYAQQIFEVFKRLHGRDIYPGSGIGLALCRRIMDNHRGHIFATSVLNEGTTFHLLLPEKQS